jgi:hypothetical protein
MQVGCAAVIWKFVVGFGLSAGDILRLYEEQGPAIFDQHHGPLKTWLRQRGRAMLHLFGSKYSSDNLRTALEGVLGNRNWARAELDWLSRRGTQSFVGTPMAGSAGAGNSAINGIPPGPANPGMRSDPSGVRNSVRMAAPRSPSISVSRVPRFH